MRMKQRQKELALIWWGLFIVWLVLTVSLSGQDGSGSYAPSNTVSSKPWQFFHKLFPNLEESEFRFYVRKLAHFGIHFVLAFFCFRASRYTFKTRPAAFFVAVTLTITIAVFDELIQMEAPGRVSIPADAIINAVGAIIGTIVSLLFG